MVILLEERVSEVFLGLEDDFFQGFQGRYEGINCIKFILLIMKNVYKEMKYKIQLYKYESYGLLWFFFFYVELNENNMKYWRQYYIVLWL